MWQVEFHTAFEEEFAELKETVQDALLARALLLSETGPQLGRPFCDTLVGSKFANMKELRFDADNGVWRVAFAFDPARNAILLAAIDKSGVNQRRAYRQLISKADDRFESHIAELRGET